MISRKLLKLFLLAAPAMALSDHCFAMSDDGLPPPQQILKDARAKSGAEAPHVYKTFGSDGRVYEWKIPQTLLQKALPDGRIVTSDAVWEVRDGKAVKVSDRTKPIRFSPDGAKIMSFDPDGIGYMGTASGETGAIWDSRTGKKLKLFSGDGSKILEENPNGTVRVLNAKTGEALGNLRSRDGLDSVWLNRQGSTIASIDEEAPDAVTLWGLDNNKGYVISARLNFGASVSGVYFARKNSMLLIAGRKTIAVWGPGLAKLKDIVVDRPFLSARFDDFGEAVVVLFKDVDLAGHTKIFSKSYPLK